MNRQGILIVVSGFSGAGKGTIMKALTERYEGYALSVSATTRSPRPGEEDGKSYFFKSVEEFEQMIADGALIDMHVMFLIIMEHREAMWKSSWQQVMSDSGN